MPAPRPWTAAFTLARARATEQQQLARRGVGALAANAGGTVRGGWASARRGATLRAAR
jgi:hypothetical protein